MNQQGFYRGALVPGSIKNGFSRPRTAIEINGGSRQLRRDNRKMRGLRAHASDWRPVLTGLAPRPPNLLVLGASGHVAQAFLMRLQLMREDFGSLVLMDPSGRVLSNPFLDHERLNYRYIKSRFSFPGDAPEYQRLLARHRIDIVLDVTDMNTLPILEATDEAGVSYVNTALNDSGRCVAGVVSMLHPTRQERRKAPHIISSGMNPGIVNIWVWDGFQHYGAPSEITHFEYDTSMPLAGWSPMITWSRKEFLAESVWDPTGLVEDGEPRKFSGNSLEFREDMRSIMEPVMHLERYPRGLLVLHEENVKLGQKLGASSKYLYAIHPRTMDYLEQIWRGSGRVEIGDLELGDNTSVPLIGSDTIGVCLEYPERRVYYLHSLANEDVKGTSATCAQVAVGIEAALAALMSDPLLPRLYFASDLYDTVYTDVVFNSLRVEHFEFERRVAPDGKIEWRTPEPASKAMRSGKEACYEYYAHEQHASL